MPDWEDIIDNLVGDRYDVKEILTALHENENHTGIWEEIGEELLLPDMDWTQLEGILQHIESEYKSEFMEYLEENLRDDLLEQIRNQETEALLDALRTIRDTHPDEWDKIVTPELMNAWDRAKRQTTEPTTSRPPQNDDDDDEEAGASPLSSEKRGKLGQF